METNGKVYTIKALLLATIGILTFLWIAPEEPRRAPVYQKMERFYDSIPDIQMIIYHPIDFQIS